MTHRFAIFGTGSMATIYAELLQQRRDVELIAVVGNSEARTQSFASTFGIQSYAGSRYEQMLADHTEIDAVIIATPEWVRDEPLSAAVSFNRHILLEKPFADSWQNARRYHGLLRNFDKVFDICHVLRHSPRFFALREAVVSGELGSVRHIYARRNSNNVRVLRVLGKTDLAFWLAPHDIDIIRWITGNEVESVHAVSRERLSSADDYLIANIHLSNGVDAVLEISWCGPPVSPSARHAVFEVRGTEGHVELEDSEMNVKVFTKGASVKAPDTYEHYDLHGQKAGYFKTMIDAFIRRLDDPAVISDSLADAVESTRACAMIRKSLDESRTVHRSEFL